DESNFIHQTSNFGSVWFAGEGDAAGARELGDAELAHEHEEFLDLRFVAGHFDAEHFVLHVHDLRPEDVAELHDLGAVGRGHGHPHEQQLALDHFVVAEIVDVDDIDQLVELLGHLLEHGIVAIDDDRHPGCGWIERGADIQRVDVEAASAEHPGDAGEHAEFVFDEDGYRVTHKKKGRGVSARSAGESNLKLAPRAGPDALPVHPILPMKLGLYIDIKHGAAFADQPFDFVEENVQTLLVPEADEATFRERLAIIRALNKPVL